MQEHKDGIHLLDSEKELLDLTMKFWKLYISLNIDKNQDNKEVNFHIDALQNIIAARPVFRMLNNE